MQIYEKNGITQQINEKREPSPMGKAPKERGLGGSDAAEHVIVRPHVVVVHEQLACVGFVVEVV